MKSHQSRFFLLLFTVFLVICLSGCGDTSKSPNQNDEEEVVVSGAVKEGITNSAGEVVFVDKDTGEEVTIIVKDNSGNPIDKMNVIYHDGSDYEVFTAVDPSGNYLPTRGFYEHNSIHVLQTSKTEDGIYKIETYNDQGIMKAVYSWESKNHMAWTTQTYHRTISNEESIQIQDRLVFLVDVYLNSILFLLSGNLSLPFSMSYVLPFIAPNDPNPPSRWDLYTYQGTDFGSATNLTLVPSNIPTVVLNTPQVTGDQVTLSWTGTDRTTYEHVPLYLPSSNLDITVYLGATDQPDLRYTSEMYKDGIFFIAWDNKAVAQLTLNNLDNGDYTFAVTVYDEVGNSSVSSEKGFTILTGGTSGPSGKIAFVSIPNSDADIYVMNADGSGLTALASTSEWEIYPSWSPDGTKILYSSKIPFSSDNDDIYIMDSDGSNKTQLTSNSMDEGSAVFSPDGTRIAYRAGFDAGGYEIFIMDSDGSNPSNITNHGDHYHWDIAWSPVSSSIAFYSNKDHSFGEIYKINSDGSNITRLTNNSYYDRFPTWSPDGSTITFSSDRSGDYEIYIMNSNGSNPVNVSNSPSTIDHNPSFSPDGSWIVYVSRDINTFDESNEIWVMSSTGENKTRITNNTYNDGSPTWSP